MNAEISFDEIPKVKSRAVRRRDGVWDLYITCPLAEIAMCPISDSELPTAALMRLTAELCWSTNWYEHNC